MASYMSLRCSFLLCLSLLLSVTVNGQRCENLQTVNGKPFPDLIDVTVEDLSTGLESGQFTSVDLVTAYLARIMQTNPVLNAVTEVNPDALTLARQMDAMRANGTTRGPLHGIPIIIKNNIATLDKMNNTAGSYALLGSTVPRDATVAAKLRAAGVIILGKANLSQWANFRSDNTSNGWSAYGGQVFGAYYPTQDPSGSSSGSGVASSVGMALGTLGTETSGSILSPAQANNLVGVKPTVGLTSRNLVIPISQRQDTVGPMTRTVKDAAYILSAIAGKDPNDNYTLANPSDSVPDYVAACNYSGLRGARIGIPRNVLGIAADNTSAPILAAFEAAISTIRKAGATIVENADFTAYQQYLDDDNSTIVLEADFINNLAEYLALLTSNPQNVYSLADVRGFTQNSSLEQYSTRDTKIWDEALGLGYNNTDSRFWAAYQANLYFGGEGGVLGALDRQNLSAVILPTSFAAGVPALVGTPVVTVPLGFYPSNTSMVKNRYGNLVTTGPNEPFGISFLGRAWSEASLISYAYAFEQRTQVRNMVQPYLVPNTELKDIVGS